MRGRNASGIRVVGGELELNFESMNLPDGSGLVVALYNAAPGSAACGTR